jgi:hypothetical protein
VHTHVPLATALGVEAGAGKNGHAVP